MRALRRFRALAAMSALLLFLAGSALADVPDRPIDSPEGPVPRPVEIGEPDTGYGFTQYFAHLFLAASLSNPVLRPISTSLLAGIRWRHVAAASTPIRR